ncbi:MAG: guanylate kinase [SAR324 cluster bacterium]
MPYPRVFVVSGPSGAGKTSILKAVRYRTPGMRMSVSVTTRAPRPNEIHGRDYFFVTRQQFQERIAQGDFLEWAQVYDNFYGTSLRTIREMLASHVHAVLDVDTQGAKSIRERCHGAVFVFVAPPGLDVLEARLRGRGTETEASLTRRLAKAGHEMSQRGMYDYVVVNDSIAKATQRFLEIVAIEQERDIPFTIISAPVDETRAVRTLAGELDQEGLLLALESEIRDTLGIEVSAWLRERMASVLRRDLERIVLEEYRAYQAGRVG